MFTIKLYSNDGGLMRIYEAESFTILRGMGGSPGADPADHDEITVHVKSGDDFRVDIGPGARTYENVPIYERAIIENAAGRTTEIVGANIPGVVRAAAA